MWLKCFTKHSLGNIGYKQRSSYWAHHLIYVDEFGLYLAFIRKPSTLFQKENGWLELWLRIETQQQYKDGLEGRQAGGWNTSEGNSFLEQFNI